MVFSAVAEAGESTYLDGECVSAASGIDLLLVADADDPGRPAPLLTVSFPL